MATALMVCTCVCLCVCVCVCVCEREKKIRMICRGSILPSPSPSLPPSLAPSLPVCESSPLTRCANRIFLLDTDCSDSIHGGHYSHRATPRTHTYTHTHTHTHQLRTVAVARAHTHARVNPAHSLAHCVCVRCAHECPLFRCCWGCPCSDSRGG